MADLLQVPLEDVAQTWPWLEDRVAYGVERSRDRFTVEGLRERALSGEWDLHFVYLDDDEAGTDKLTKERITAVLLTQLFDEMGGDRVCSIRFLAGKNLAEWSWLINALELWAMRNGCTLMSFVTRRGIARELRDFDYKQASALIEKRLKPKAKDNAGRQAIDGDGRAEHRSGRPAAVRPDIQPGGQSPRHHDRAGAG